MQASNGADFDVLAFDTSIFQRYIDAGLLAPLDVSKIPNAANLAQSSATFRQSCAAAISTACPSAGVRCRHP